MRHILTVIDMMSLYNHQGLTTLPTCHNHSAYYYNYSRPNLSSFANDYIHQKVTKKYNPSLGGSNETRATSLLLNLARSSTQTLLASHICYEENSIFKYDQINLM